MNRLRLSLAVASLILLATATPASASEPIEIPPDGNSLIYGKEVRLYECWNSGTGETVALQVKSGSKWVSVSTSKIRKRLAICDGPGSMYRWRVDMLGQSMGLKCGVKTFLLEMRTVSPKTAKVWDVWTMEQYASQDDYYAAIRGVLDRVFGGKNC